MSTRTERERERRDTMSTRARNALSWATVALVAVGAGACDFDVTNPGPVPDDFLDDPDAHQALIAGMARAFQEQHSELARVMGAATREVFPSGNTGIYGITVNEGLGVFPVDQVDAFWADAHNARWTAEDGVRRLQEVLDDGAFNSSAVVAEAYLWAGYSNRFLGENFCEAVFDGGSAEPRSAYFTRAETQLTNAFQIGQAAGADDVAIAAQAARASVRIYLDDWTGARADAAAVPDDFEHELDYSDAEQPQYNTIYYSVANQPYRGHSVWNTPYEQYYLDYDDPRTPWDQDPEFPHGPVQRQCCGLVPWYFQTKYDQVGDNIDLSDGREMRLIEAEGLLRDGSMGPAMAIITQLRADVPVADWPAPADMDEAWALLKREKGIELWLEGRRAGDLWRWEQDAAPGALHPLEDPANPDTFLERTSAPCVPISQGERETNPNVS